MTKANIKRTVFILSLMFTGTVVWAQDQAALAGVWRVDDGSATVRISTCSGSSNWCATVIEEKLKPGETSMMNKVVARDMRPIDKKGGSKKGWSGRMVADDGQSYKATAKQQGQDGLTFKICVMPLLCDTMRLNRVR